LPQSTAALAKAVQSALRINQIGYLPNALKRATLVSSSDTPLDWQLANRAGLVVASGQTIVFGEDASSGDHVHVVDFSSYTLPEEGYRLAVGDEISPPFSISADVYRSLKYDALAYFYHNRSGIAITMPYAGRSDLARPAGHIGVAPNQGDTKVACAPDVGASYSLDVAGGWYDAGDHGKYLVNGGISLWTLQNLYERIACRGSSLADFADGTMNIPEHANGFPDLLDEARWELEFFLKMQVPEGQPKAGMVHHKVHDAAWTSLPLRPDQDPQPRQLRPVSTAATLNLAATAAQGARLWRELDPDFAARCLAAAERAWRAALAHPDLYITSADIVGGGPYGDENVEDEFYWAACELFVTTGGADYLDHLARSPYFATVPTELSETSEPAMTWGTTQAMGTISLALVPSALPEEQLAAVQAGLVRAADTFAAVVESEGYGTPLALNDQGYPWGSNSFVLNNAIIMALAYDLTGESRYLDGVVQSMDYILGRNALAKSYVTGYGLNPAENPHHRFWAYQANSSYPRPPAGVLVGGPNSGLQDGHARSCGLDGHPPQKCYVDHIESWSTNEVTINWNAALAWVAAFLDEQSPVCVPSGDVASL
jgi:endoglucanase